MDMNSIRRKNLAALVSKVGSQTEFAKLVGTNRLYISQILSDVTARALGTKLARRIETAMGLEAGFMDVEQGVGSQVAAAPSKRLLPQLSEAQALRFQQLDSDESGSSGIQVTFSDVGARAFALQVGRQEVSQVPAGAMIVVDPDMKPRSEDVVLVGSEAAGRVFVRKLDIGLTGQRLVSDTLGENVAMPDGAAVLGVVREVSLRLR